MELSPVVKALVDIFAAEPPAGKSGTHLTVSRTVSTIAVLYEKARNAVEFRAEHLVRRAAIERILKRRLLIGSRKEAIAEHLITELLWAKYFDSSLIDEQVLNNVQSIIERYLVVKHDLFASSSRYGNLSWDFILGVASAEIDETIVPAKKRQALIDFFYQVLRPKISLPSTDESYANTMTYIAVERAYAKADDELIAFHLLKSIDPEWMTVAPPQAREATPVFAKTMTYIATSLRDQAGNTVARFIRSQVAPLLLLSDFFFDVGNKSKEYIDDPDKLSLKLTEIANRRYQEIGTKVRRAVVRSFIYIFLTKMIFALALEVPYDLYVAKRITYLPLIINTLFPPLLLFLVAGLFSVPGEDNTLRLIDRIKTILYHFDDIKNEASSFTLKRQVRRPLLTAVFSLIYLATFVVTFGLINLALTTLHFSIASEIIFVFFVALVSFFAYRIRASAKEYEIVDRQGVLEPMVDFFFLPVIHAGHWLSSEIAKINIFIFLFDFILEAPLKVIFEVVEEWIRFVRTKKEEII